MPVSYHSFIFNFDFELPSTFRFFLFFSVKKKKYTSTIIIKKKLYLQSKPDAIPSAAGADVSGGCIAVDWGFAGRAGSRRVGR